MNYKTKGQKACRGSKIPVKIIKENTDVIIYFVYNSSNNSLFSPYFPQNLKNADITPVLKTMIAKTLKTTAL